MNTRPNTSKWGIDLRPIIVYGFSVLKMSDTKIAEELCISRERIRQLRRKVKISYPQCVKCGKRLRTLDREVCLDCTSKKGYKICVCGRKMMQTSEKCKRCNHLEYLREYNKLPKAIEARERYYSKLKDNPERYREVLRKNRERYKRGVVS